MIMYKAITNTKISDERIMNMAQYRFDEAIKRGSPLIDLSTGKELSVYQIFQISKENLESDTMKNLIKKNS